MSKYLDVFTDFGFKKVFASPENKTILISFLNSLLPANNQIKDLEFADKEKLGFNYDDRKVIFDLYCITNDNRRIIVELQNNNQQFYLDRTIYYSTFPIQEQARKKIEETNKRWDYYLDSVFCISILNFNIIDDDKYIRTVELKDEDNKIIYDKLKYIYIEIKKFNKKLEELQNIQDEWLYFFKHSRGLNEIPEQLKNSPVENAFFISELGQMNRDERYQYERNLKELFNMESSISTAKKIGREEGLEEGRQEGLEEGIEKGKIEMQRNIAKSLLSMGLDIKEISKITSLSIEEIQKIN